MIVTDRLIQFSLLLASLLVTSSALAINFNDELTRDVDVAKSGGQFIPDAFYNDSTGIAVATVFLGKGYVQPQVITVANAFVGTSGSYNLFLANTDWYNNLTHGTNQRLTFAKDSGWLDKSVEWTAVSFRHSE